MTSTTLRIPPALKKKVQAAAKQQRLSAHAFMLEAITHHTEVSAKRAAFVAAAVSADAEVKAGARTIPLHEARDRLLKRLKGRRR